MPLIVKSTIVIIEIGHSNIGDFINLWVWVDLASRQTSLFSMKCLAFKGRNETHFFYDRFDKKSSNGPGADIPTDLSANTARRWVVTFAGEAATVPENLINGIRCDAE